jgi:DMSO/TMAO reductase YedYZ molybdopterin-dependent catalytic subunit
VGDWFVEHGTDVETAWSGAVPYRTPTERFFVRNHTESPEIDPTTWRLLVTGDGITRETTWSLPQLEALTSVTRDYALECTGNARREYAAQQGTPRPGTQWGLGAVGLASWTGVPLRTLLHHAGLRADAEQVMAVGLDAPYVTDGIDHGRVRRPLPVGKALDDVLVAWEMNGGPLPRDHGFPVRLVVPGWVGIASIKWLGELRVTRHRVDSPWNTRWYRMHGAGWSGPAAELGRMPVKSSLDDAGDPRPGRECVLRGRAWSGEAAIAGVEVSTDGGHGWRPATLTGPNEASCWTAWELAWTPSTGGVHEIRVRATDTAGRVQPDVAADNADGYFFDAVLRTPVDVRA